MRKSIRNGLLILAGVGALAGGVLISKNILSGQPEAEHTKNTLEMPETKLEPVQKDSRSYDPESLELSLRESYGEHQIEEPEDDFFLSNGMRIREYSLDGVIDTNWGKVFILDTGYPSPEYDIRIFDTGDGQPFVFDEIYKTDERGFDLRDPEKGVKLLDHLEKRLNLTYRFCNESHGPYGDGTYPIWEPTAFRGDPCYGVISPVKRDEN